MFFFQLKKLNYLTVFMYSSESGPLSCPIWSGSLKYKVAKSNLNFLNQLTNSSTLCSNKYEFVYFKNMSGCLVQTSLPVQNDDAVLRPFLNKQHYA